LPSPKLDDIYRATALAKHELEPGMNAPDTLFLTQHSGPAIADEFGVSEIAVEVERAVEQVEKKLAKQASDHSTASPDAKEKI